MSAQQSRFVLRILLARASACFDILLARVSACFDILLARVSACFDVSRLVLPVMAGLLMTGCNMILWGNLGVLAVAVGIFLGTVFLSRSSAASRSASRSLSPTSSGAGANSAADGTRS
jgi:hypothetical protein